MPVAPSAVAAVAVPVPAKFPALASRSHHRYASTVSALNDSYARTAAAQQRRTAHQTQQAAHAAQLARLAQRQSQLALDRQFLFREHVLATTNAHKTTRIRLECESGLRASKGVEGSVDWPRFETVDVRLQEWVCSGARTRVLEEDGWKDEGKAREVEERVAQLQDADRQRELLRREAQQQQRHTAIHAQFAQQRQLNQSRTAYIRHHFAATAPHHLTPPASFLDSVRGRARSRAGEARDGDSDGGSSGRGSGLSTARNGEGSSRRSHRSVVSSLPSLPSVGPRRASHQPQPVLPPIADDEHNNRRHTVSHPRHHTYASQQPVATQATTVVTAEHREDLYDDCTFDTEQTTSIAPALPITVATQLSVPFQSLSPLNPVSPLNADATVSVPGGVLRSAVQSELQWFESKLPDVYAKDKHRERPIYFTVKHQRQHH